MRRNPPNIEAVLLAGIYALVGVLWIFYSDRYTSHLAGDAYELTLIQTYKGWGYIALTTLLVYAIIRFAQHQQTSSGEKSERLRRVQRVLNEAGRSIIKSRDADEMFHAVCEIAAKEGGFGLAWAGLVDGMGQRIRIVATAGSEAGRAEAIDIDLEGPDGASCPICQAFKQGRPFVSDDLVKMACGSAWCRMVVGLGLDSMLAAPIMINGELRGAIAFYARETRFFAGEEMRLLESLASDLGLAMAHIETERRWITAIEAAGHSVWDVNPVTRRIFYSPQWKRSLGYAEDEIGNDMSEWLDRIHPDDLPICYEQIERIDGGESQTFVAEYRMRCKDGVYKWIKAQGLVVARDAGGRPLRIIGTDTDVTERMNRERALQEAQRAARIGSYIYDVRNDLWNCTTVLEELFGIAPGYAKTAAGWLAIIRPDRQADVRKYLKDVLAVSRKFDLEYPIIRPKDGAERWLHGQGEVELAPDGRPLRMVGTIQDVTERRRANLMLKARADLSLLAQEGRVRDLLQKALDVAEEITGSRIGFFHFVDPDDESLSLQAWSTNTRANMCKAEGVETHYPLSKAGVWADCVRSMSPVIHNDYANLPGRKGLPEGHAPILRELTVPTLRQGRVAAVAGVGNKLTNYTQSDVVVLEELAGYVMDLVSNIEAESSLRASEAKLRKTTESLQGAVDNLTQLNTELERFAFIASHDLQEPLRNITTYTQLIERKFKDKIGEEGADYFDLVIGGAKRMYALINDLLTYSRTGVNSRPPQLIATSQSCKAAIENLYSPIRESDVLIDVGELPSLVVDEVQMMQLFQNLLANAIKFRHPERQAHVKISAKPVDGFWQFTVADNGIGFNPGEQDVFELFRRVHSNRGYAGTGVGLAICKRIVLRNGGRIWAESTPGKGSAFHFILPDCQEAPAALAEDAR